jgi:hypothetical protein
MTSEQMLRELEREPFVPMRLHLASGQIMEIHYPGTAWVRQNTLLVVHPLARNTSMISNYDVIALLLVERIEQIGEPSAA